MIGQWYWEKATIPGLLLGEGKMVGKTACTLKISNVYRTKSMVAEHRM